MGNLSGEIVFSHDTCYAAEQGNSNCQVFFVRRSQQAKLGVCCSGPEGRNTAHFLALDDRIKERENLACPCCSFELHAMKTSLWMMEIHSFSRAWLCRLNWEQLFSIVVSFGGGLLWFFEIWRHWTAHPSTSASSMFFPDFESLKNHKWGVASENSGVDRFWSLE